MVEHLAVNEVVPGSSPGFGAFLDLRTGKKRSLRRNADVAFPSREQWCIAVGNADRH